VAVARLGAAGDARSGAFSDAGTAAPVAVAAFEVRALLVPVAAGSAGADVVAGALLAFVLLPDDSLGAGSFVEAAAEVSAEAALAFDLLDFFGAVASAGVAGDASAAAASDFVLLLDLADPESFDAAPLADVVLSSVAFFFFDDLVEEAGPDEARVSAELAALLLLLDDFAFEVWDGAVELSEEVALDFLDFFGLLGVVVDD
jgi:hypothetical protein